MGLHEIRTAMKVDLKKPAAEQPGLHVSLSSRRKRRFRPAYDHLEQMAPGWYSDMYFSGHWRKY